jgi:NADP-dependent 3-hydroxy acid dehydrogenase YdfG
MNTQSKVLLVCGHGPGISDHVAQKFGAEGFSVALVARSADRLSKAVAALEAKNVRAAAFAVDLGDPNAVKKLVADVHAQLGPITIVHFNAYRGIAGDLLTADVSELHAILDINVTGLVVAVREALPDLKEQKGAVLVTGGGFALFDPNVDAAATQWNSQGLALGKAAQHKVVGLLDAKLRSEGIYVGEVMVLGTVKGTAWDSGNATLEPGAIANRFWELYSARAPLSVSMG